jgi:hypothetical protein
MIKRRSIRCVFFLPQFFYPIPGAALIKKLLFFNVTLKELHLITIIQTYDN